VRAALLAAGLAAVAYVSWRAGVSRPLAPGAVIVEATDLDYLLGHYYDEVLGSPDRAHWRFPLLREVADRLADATRPPGSAVHPALVRRGEPPAAGYSGAI
jgi:hypothetical protein